jgi:RNase P/RNase MRP subunit p30
MVDFTDLHVLAGGEVLEIAERIGWNSLCLVKRFKSSRRTDLDEFQVFKESVKDTKLKTCFGVELHPTKPEDAQGMIRDFREADVIFVVGDDSIHTKASECLELDVISSPELSEKGDFMHQMNSGLDYVMARSCAERGIAVELNFANILNSQGRRRAQIMARMAQNARICRDCGCGLVITSGATSPHGLRAPLDLMAIGTLLDLSPEEAKTAVSLNPQKILSRSRDRANPNIVLRGLEVKDWGTIKQKEKRLYGWY